MPWVCLDSTAVKLVVMLAYILGALTSKCLLAYPASPIVGKPEADICDASTCELLGLLTIHAHTHFCASESWVCRA